MKKSKVLVLLLVLALVCTSFAACGERGGEGGEADGGETIVIKYGNTDPETKSTTVAAEWLKEYMAEQTDGRVQVEVYPNGQLGDDEELLKGVKLGTVQLYVGIGNVSTAAGPKANLIELPFIYNSYEDWYTGSFEKGGLDLFNQMIADSGLVCLDFQYEGFKSILSAKQVYKSMDELKGFKIRVTPTDLNLAIWQALGANPTPVSWGEVYTSMTQGVVDGIDHTQGTWLSAKLYEAAKYATITNHVVSPFTVVTSQTFLDSLPDDIRDIFLEGVAQMGDMQRELELENSKSYLQQLADLGVEIYEAPEEFRSEMKALMGPVYDMQREICGADVVDAFIATGGNE